MPAKNTKKQPDPDWRAVSKDYVQGVLSLNKICEKYTNKKIKLNKSRLIYQMKRRGFHAQRIETREKAKVTASNKESTEIAQNTADGLQEVTRRHVNGLRELQDMAVIMSENMKRALQSVEIAGDEKDKIITPAFLGSRETPMDYMKKLTEVFTKTIQMERVCLGLDKELPDDGEKSYEDRLKELHEEQPALPDDSNSNVIDGEFTEVQEPKKVKK
jgi:hypothetical protein